MRTTSTAKRSSLSRRPKVARRKPPPSRPKKPHHQQSRVPGARKPRQLPSPTLMSLTHFRTSLFRPRKDVRRRRPRLPKLKMKRSPRRSHRSARAGRRKPLQPTRIRCFRHQLAVHSCGMASLWWNRAMLLLPRYAEDRLA